MSLPHDSAHTHVTGLSEFIDDRAALKGEVIVEVVYSPHAKARIKKIKFDKTLNVPGVLAVYTAKDFPHNAWGTIFKDQPLLAADEVNFVGEAVALVVGDDRESAAIGRALVEVQYEVLPAILNIESAKEQKSFIGEERKIERGNVKEALSSAPHQLEGKIVIRGADHFYLESQVSIVYPGEDGQLEVHSSSQHPTETQHVVAHSLGISSKDVVCIVKRMGGAFGGKESQAAPFAAYAALAALRLKRPARIVLTKDDDMIMTGKRNPFENIYKVGFDNNGKILALDIALFSDGGAYADLSTSIMERAMLHSDNAYFIPNMSTRGQVCRTNFHPHTAFRGFGGPKGVATVEKIIEQIAHVLKIDPLTVRKSNCYTNTDGRNITHYKQVVENNCLPELFNQLEVDCNYFERRKDIDEHNKRVISEHSPLPLRGLSLTAVKFGISFTTRFLNQANAFIIIHRDGTLQVATGATEMGQGVNARIAELVATEFGIDRHQVRMMPTRTDKNGNTSPTAASSGTDLNGAAALIAARKIKARLSELAFKLFNIPESHWARHSASLGTQEEVTVTDIKVDNTKANFDADFKSGIATYHDIAFDDGHVYLKSNPQNKIAFFALINEAYLNRISLSDYAHYKIPGISFNKLSGKGDAFLYFTQGVAASEVSIDQDTGEMKVLRSDILMDLGRPINEALDRGQVTGGFVQGMGWVSSEKLFYSPQGALLSHAPSTYKIPSVQDIPRVFLVKLFENPNNVANVRGTKASGEPPLLLAVSVWTAIQNALSYLPHFKNTYPDLELPATREQILRAQFPELFSEWETHE